MADKFTDMFVKRAPAPAEGKAHYWDKTVPGFGIRVTASGVRAFILNYRTAAGRERRYTIGRFPEWCTTSARDEARRLKRKIRIDGADPVGGLEQARGATTVADLVDRYIEEHLPKKRPSSQAEDMSIIRRWIRPSVLMREHVANVDYVHIDALHRKITKAGLPYRANRTVALLSKMFSLSIRWRMRKDNPCAGIERNQEHKRQRFLTGAELERLTKALVEFEDQQASNIIRMLLLTGARRGEVLAMRWSDVDLEAGGWTKPGATTKQKTEHRVPLSAPARLLLATMASKVGVESRFEYVFPGQAGGHRVDLKRPWPAICKAADIEGVRVHDLRHTYASLLAGSGQSLPIIGALLGHTQASTTLRYAHLLDDPLRVATETGRRHHRRRAQRSSARRVR